MNAPIFCDGGVYDEIFVMEDVPVRLIAKISIRDGDVLLYNVFFYPLTSVRMKFGTRNVLQMYRFISDKAAAEGFLSCSTDAFRSSGARPGRIMHLTRRL